jgi:dynactin complex subunit
VVWQPWILNIIVLAVESYLNFSAQKMEIEIEVNRRLQILLDKLMMVENRISILSRRVAQLEQEMDTSIEEEDSSEDTSGSDIEVIYPAGICYFCF